MAAHHLIDDANGNTVFRLDGAILHTNRAACIGVCAVADQPTDNISAKFYFCKDDGQGHAIPDFDKYGSIDAIIAISNQDCWKKGVSPETYQSRSGKLSVKSPTLTFDGKLKLQYQITNPGDVKIFIYGITGKEISNMVFHQSELGPFSFFPDINYHGECFVEFMFNNEIIVQKIIL